MSTCVYSDKIVHFESVIWTYTVQKCQLVAVKKRILSQMQGILAYLKQRIIKIILDKSNFQFLKDLTPLLQKLTHFDALQSLQQSKFKNTVRRTQCHYKQFTFSTKLLKRSCSIIDKQFYIFHNVIKTFMYRNKCTILHFTQRY